MTATAILQLLGKAGLTVDTKVSPYVYPDWTQGPNVNQLTFKELLTHTSGFGQLANNACGNGITYADLKTIVAGGVSSSNIGQPSYGNCNFALLRELMPALSGHPLSGVPDGSQRAQQSSTQYINYMNANVFQPVGISTSAWWLHVPATKKATGPHGLPPSVFVFCPWLADGRRLTEMPFFHGHPSAP